MKKSIAMFVEAGTGAGLITLGYQNFVGHKDMHFFLVVVGVIFVIGSFFQSDEKEKIAASKQSGEGSQIGESYDHGLGEAGTGPAQAGA